VLPRSLVLIDAPSSAGAYAPGQEKAPWALREAGLVTRLDQAGITVCDGGTLPVWRWRPDPKDRFAQNRGAVATDVTAVAACVQTALETGAIALVLGGDCTVGLGTVAGHLPAYPALWAALL